MKTIGGGRLNGDKLRWLAQIQIYAAVEIHADRSSSPGRRGNIKIDCRAHFGLPAPAQASIREISFEAFIGNYGVAAGRQIRLLRELRRFIPHDSRIRSI